MALANLRIKLAKPEPSWQLCLLGVIGATIAAIFIILFRLAFESIQLIYLQNVDDYTSLTEIQRFITPIIATLGILLVAWVTGFKYSRSGIPFVIHRLKTAYGAIPFLNTINQFFGSIFALAGGFSIGREGPAVHIGAACSTILAKRFSLPQNSMRTLCACGVAAGISASFNTPLAAVIFVMEVILREYKLHMFVPVILASIVGSLMTHAVFGSYHEYEFFAYLVIDYAHYPWLILFGVLLGCLAKLFNVGMLAVIRVSQHQHMTVRLLVAALIMGTMGYWVPESMGSSVSAIDLILEEEMVFTLIISLLCAKMIATIGVLGLGIPGGIIGPTLGIGAIAGALMSLLVGIFFNDMRFAGDYALLGMAGMLAATLNAPLAALLTIIELADQLQLALPAMVVITSAYLTSSQFLKNRSIFLQQLEFQNLSYQPSPVENILQKYGVLAYLEDKYQIIKDTEEANLSEIIRAAPGDEQIIVHCPAEDDEPEQFKLVQYDLNQHPLEHEGPAYRLSTMPAVDSQATLSEAYFALVEMRQGAVYVYHKDPANIIGIVSFNKIRGLLTKGAI
ncbi:chloride channel protein [Thalassotalea mangrovi]|uniref:Chloride channel protein n=1 Tax=Thalassotalea mangrovi TaxID=2572245 RepID=A0A4U1B4P8_9GAMM|nr:chloride channel protein [Thalassotalea mangrovi]TKB45343.1 chloride channel protein [Thalassotalea mangrovi]